jgi:hypothetical protein
LEFQRYREELRRLFEGRQRIGDMGTRLVGSGKRTPVAEILAEQWGLMSHVRALWQALEPDAIAHRWRQACLRAAIECGVAGYTEPTRTPVPVRAFAVRATGSPRGRR